MKFLKRVLFALITIIALVLVVALFVKKDYKVVRSVTIEKPKDQVFNYIKHLKNHNEFQVWSKLDPNIKNEFSGTDGTVGFIHSWEGNKKVGIGEQEITKIVEGKRIETELRFTEPMESTGQAYMTTETVDENNTEVTWGMTGKMNYPMNIMCLFMDSMIGKDLQEGLDNLKNVMESKEMAKAGTKEFLTNYFHKTTNNLKNIVAGLSEDQLTFKPNDSTWSVAQCLEHIVKSETALFQFAKKTIESEPADTSLTEISTDKEFIAMITDRSQKANASTSLQPTGKYTDETVALSDWKAARDSVLQYINKIPLETMRSRRTESPAGTIDGYQNLLFIAAHSARHTLQIEEVMANDQFPEQ